MIHDTQLRSSRAPHGARGLKLCIDSDTLYGYESRPARGAWIETPVARGVSPAGTVAPRTGRVD